MTYPGKPSSLSGGSDRGGSPPPCRPGRDISDRLQERGEGVRGAGASAAGGGANGVTRHVIIEPFRVYAEPELSAAPPWVDGTCFNPACGAAFLPAREWQIYCCGACEAAGKAELRRWGHRAALALLVWRMGKYEASGPVAERTRAARRYVTHLQSAWLRERHAMGVWHE